MNNKDLLTEATMKAINKTESKKAQLKKLEGVQDERLANSIQMFKDRGYEEYSQGDNYVALLDNRDVNAPVLAMFYGKSAKPAWHYRFRNMNELDKYLQKYLADKEVSAQRKADRRAQRRLTKDHDVKVGDIYYTSWGYDQTNIDFYEVVNVRGVRIDLKELAVKYIGHEGQEDIITPIPGQYANDEIHTVSARADGTLTALSSFEYLHKWDGKPAYQTDAYSGH